MKVLLESWVGNLLELFSKEVGLYREILQLETEKTNAIIEANGKKIESCVKKTYELMVTAAEIEKSRLKSINEIYQKASLVKYNNEITLSGFLNQIDRDSNFRLKGVTQSLKETVGLLKEKIVTNEKLLISRKALFAKTLEAIQSAQNEAVYLPGKETGKRKSKPLMVNMQA